MTKRKMVQHNLVKNAVAAYFAAIEIHNKPSITYRYETVTLLLTNAWELIVKAYVKKNIKGRSIFEHDGHTISFDKALKYVNDHINEKISNGFTAIKANLDAIEDYRNSIAHFYNEQLVPCIFTLVSCCALNFVDFVKKFFQKDIMADESLFILPLGFKLPFRPEDFLSNASPAYTSSPEAKRFIDKIVKIIENLQAKGIEDSIVLGFDMYLQSVKKVQNSDLLVSIASSKEEASTTFVKVTSVRLSDDPNAQTVNMNDDEFRAIYKYTYADVVAWCKANIQDFRQNKRFIEAKNTVDSVIGCIYIRRLDNQNKKSLSKKFYSDKALELIKAYYNQL